MHFSENIYLNDLGNLVFDFKQDGFLVIYSDAQKEVNFCAKIISLDTNLTCNFLHHITPIGSNVWYYLSKVNPLLSENHPGFILEIYKSNSTELLFRKIYHNVKNQICLHLESNENEILYDSYYSFFYEQNFKKYFNICENDVVYDLGANIGSFSLAASNYFPKKIYAFEPHPENFKYLQNNCNKYGKNIICYEKAVSSDFGTVNFGGGGSVGYKIDSNYNLSVDSVNLEKFGYYNNLLKPSYLKIDVEGAEYTFFDENNTSDSFFSSIHSIFLEFHNNDGKNLEKIIRRCKKLGYDMITHDQNTINDVVGFILFFKNRN